MEDTWRDRVELESYAVFFFFLKVFLGGLDFFLFL